MKQQIICKEPKNLYEPIDYIINLNGKRLRPVLTLLVAELFGADYKKALPAAMTIEVFHNFSLIHDDIMDNAPLRRGKATVHEKWNVNTGILSGDAMLVLAYKYLEEYEPSVFRDLVVLFNKTALEVCEGQQMDMDFETTKSVSVDEYLKMIQYKTSVLLAAAMKMGAIIASVDVNTANLIYSFGLNLGCAFQLQDDFLDSFGNEETFGKQIGGDIIANKKTYLYIKALELSDAKDAERLDALYSNNIGDNTKKIAETKDIFVRSGATAATKEIIQEYTHKAFEVLNNINLPAKEKEIIKNFGESLMRREV